MAFRTDMLVEVNAKLAKRCLALNSEHRGTTPVIRLNFIDPQGKLQLVLL